MGTNYLFRCLYEQNRVLKLNLVLLRCKYDSKRTAVKKLYISKSERRTVETKHAGSFMKKLNFENEKLFGPLLKTAPQVKSDYQIGMGDIDKEAIYKGILEPSKKITKVKIKETGFKDFNVHPIDNNEKIIEEPISNPRLTREVNDISFKQQGEPLKLNAQKLLELLSSSEIYAKNISDFPLQNLQRTDKIELINDGVLQLPKLPLKMNHSNMHFPNVTGILNKTMSDESRKFLERWKKRMIEALGHDGFNDYQKKLFDRGSSLHKSISETLQGVPETELKVHPANEGHWESLKEILPFFHDVELIETPVAHPYLMYKGIVDCVAKYRNYLVVIDWKTSQRSKPSLKETYDTPLQVVAYMGAINFDPNLALSVDSALIVIAYEDGTPGHVHFIDPETARKYWRDWLQRLRLFWELVRNEIALKKAS